MVIALFLIGLLGENPQMLYVQALMVGVVKVGAGGEWSRVVCRDIMISLRNERVARKLIVDYDDVLIL